MNNDEARTTTDELIHQLANEDQGIAVLHALEAHFGWEILVATRNDAVIRLQEMTGDESADLSDEEWKNVSERIDFANDAMMEDFWLLVEQALMDVLPDERTQPAEDTVSEGPKSLGSVPKHTYEPSLDDGNPGHICGVCGNSRDWHPRSWR